MDAKYIEHYISERMSCANVSVTGDDGVHFDATVVSTEFEGVMPVKRQQMVYTVIGELITTGQVHALGMKTYTPQEWQHKNS